MNAEFFALAFTAALNPKLLAIDLLLIENRRPRAMFLCLLLGGMTTALTIGLLDVLTVHADDISSQGKVSAGVDLALGLLLLVLGALLATGRLHRRQRTPVPAGTGAGETGETGEKGQLAAAAAGRAKARAGHAGRRAHRPARRQLHYRTAQPGGRKYSTATQVVAVVVFVIIDFLLIIIPFAFLELRPEATKVFLKRAQDWLTGHVLQLMVGIALALGAYLTISALVRLS